MHKDSLFLGTVLLVCTVAAQQPSNSQRKSNPSGPNDSVSTPSRPKPESKSKVLGPPAPITLTILHDKNYPFSARLFDGTPEIGLMALTAVVKNVSNNQITVSTFSPAVIGVTSITYRGCRQTGNPRRLVPEWRQTLFEDDPNGSAAQSLVTLDSGATVRIPIDVIYRADLTGGRATTTAIYTPPGEGTYTLTFQYFYGGPDNNSPAVYHFAVASAPITTFVGSKKCFE